MQHVDGDERPAGPGRRHYLCQPVADDRAERVRGADKQRPAAADLVQVDIGELEERRRARDMQGGALSVRPDGEDRG